MLELTSSQRKVLRSLAHSLKPLVQVGKGGLTEAVVRQVDGALDAHELIKVRLAGEREERGEMAGELARASGAAVVGTLGRVAILYRRHPEADKRRIRLPA